MDQQGDIDGIAVVCLDSKGESALIEYTDGEGKLCRAYVPRDKIKEGRVSVTVMRKSIPYGLPWADLLDLSHITPESLETALHDVGIWTAGDLSILDRSLIRISINAIGKAVWAAAQKAKKGA